MRAAKQLDYNRPIPSGVWRSLVARSVRDAEAEGSSPSTPTAESPTTVSAMPAEWSLDVAIAPDGAINRLGAAINQRPRRAFGVLKTDKEFIGGVAGDHFEIWERSQRAVHAVGKVAGRSGGTRIEMRFPLSPTTRVLLVLFWALYLVVAGGIAVQVPDADLSLEEVFVAAAGAALLGILFAGAAQRQRTDLRTFVEGLFSDVRRDSLLDRPVDGVR